MIIWKNWDIWMRFIPQTWDEHDLTVRANLKYGLVTGFYPIDWFSKLSWGSTRDESGGLKPWHRLTEYKNQNILRKIQRGYQDKNC